MSGASGQWDLEVRRPLAWGVPVLLGTVTSGPALRHAGVLCLAIWDFVTLKVKWTLWGGFYHLEPPGTLPGNQECQGLPMPSLGG